MLIPGDTPGRIVRELLHHSAQVDIKVSVIPTVAEVVTGKVKMGVRDVEAIFGAHREALTRFANNTIHQNVSEQARMLSVRVQQTRSLTCARSCTFSAGL